MGSSMPVLLAVTIRAYHQIATKCGPKLLHERKSAVITWIYPWILPLISAKLRAQSGRQNKFSAKLQFATKL